jgi:hypothetical protein
MILGAVRSDRTILVPAEEPPAGVASAPRPTSAATASRHRVIPAKLQAGGWENRSAPTPRLIRCQNLAAQPPSPEREIALIAALEDLAAADPTQALALAGAESDAQLRQKLLYAVLRFWAGVAPEAAARGAFALPEAERGAAMAAVFAGAAGPADDVVRLACRLCQCDPVRAGDYGEALISALSEKGEDGAAVRFALAAAPAEEGEERVKWLQSAFSNWAQREPELAALASFRLPDAGARFEALMAVIPHWVQIDPTGAASVVRTLPEEVDRRNLIGETLRQWVTLDPVEAADWMSRLDPNPDLDPGTVALATLPPLVARRPDVAISWAESISDPQLRSHTLAEIVRQWASSDPPAARSYLAHSTQVLDDDRAGTDCGG